MPKLLPPEEAFLVAAAMPDAQTARLDYTLTADTYLYRDKLAYVVKSPADVKVASVDTPAGEVKDDPTFGRTEVYHQDFAAGVTLSRALAAGEQLVLEATWQGCNEAVGVCYPPITRDFTLTAGPAGAAVIAGAQTAPVEPASESDTSRIERVLKGGSFWPVVVTFFGLGLLLALTPCVFPMIPILSGIIVGQSTKVTKTSGFLLSLAYVLGMAITYAVAGVAAALSGTLISNALQNPWALGVGALIFVGLALSMFGFYELQLPSALQSKFSERANKMKGGNFFGVFAMGALSAVILGPCVAPPLAAALAFIAQTGNTVLGGVALFVLALGMGVPLLLIGLSAGALLPRAGGWMNAVKYFFGVMMLAIAIYLISPVVPGWVGMLLWALLLIACAIFLHALDPLPAHATGWSRLWKGLGVVLLIGGLAILLGMLAGSRNLLQPLDVFKGARRRGDGGRAEGPGVREGEGRGRARRAPGRGQGRRPRGDARLLCRLVRVVQGNGKLHLQRCPGAGAAGGRGAAEGRRHRQQRRRQGAAEALQPVRPARADFLEHRRRAVGFQGNRLREGRQVPGEHRLGAGTLTHPGRLTAYDSTGALARSGSESFRAGAAIPQSRPAAA